MKNSGKKNGLIKIIFSILLLIIGIEFIAISNIRMDLEPKEELLESSVSYEAGTDEKTNDTSTIALGNENNSNFENKIFYADNISLIIPNNETAIPEGLDLIKKRLRKSKTLSKYIGKNSDYFSLYLENDTEHLQITATKMILDIKLEEGSTFQGVYKVINEKEVDELPYYKLKDNEIEVEINSLGEYAIRYEDVEVELGQELKEISYTFNNENLWGLAIGAIFIGLAFYIIIHTLRGKNRVHV